MSSDEPPLERTRSEQVAEASLSAVREQKKRIIETGMSKVTFFVGVMNVMLTAFVVGRWPQHYWLYHTAKASLMLPVRTWRTWRSKWVLSMAELCWVTNYLVLAMSLLLVAGVFYELPLVDQEIARRAWYVFFVLTVGPLGGSVVALGNALVFHSFDNTVTVFIHSSPLLACWCIQGGDGFASFHAAWPRLLVGVESHQPNWATDLFLPGLAYYVCWWVPYSIWLLSCGMYSATTTGYHTTYDPFEKVVMRQLPFLDGRRRATVCVYLMGHLAMSTSAIAWSSCLYFSYTAFTAWGWFLAAAASWNGASRYHYYMIDVYEKKLTGAIETQRKDKAAML